MPVQELDRDYITEGMTELPEGAPRLVTTRKCRTGAEGERELAPITNRPLGYFVARYAALAEVEDVSARPQALFRVRDGRESAAAQADADHGPRLSGPHAGLCAWH